MLLILQVTEPVGFLKRLFSGKRQAITTERVQAGERTVTVLRVPQPLLHSSELLAALGARRGSVLVPESLEKEAFLRPYLFSGERDYRRQCFLALVRELSGGTYRRRTLTVLDENACNAGHWQEVLPFVRTLTVVTQKTPATAAWAQRCFREFGTLPVVLPKKPEHFSASLVADFDSCTERQGLEWRVEGEMRHIFPDSKCFVVPEEMRALLDTGVREAVLAAALRETER